MKMKVGDNVAYTLSRYDKFYGKDGISSRGVSEYREKRYGVIVQVVEHDNQVRFVVIKPTKIISPEGCKPVQNCMDTVRPWEVRKHGKET